METQAQLVREKLEGIKALLTKTLMEAHDVIEDTPFEDGIAELIHSNKKGCYKFMEAKVGLDDELLGMRARIYNMFQPYLSALFLFEGLPYETDSEEEVEEEKTEEQPILVVVGNRPE